MSEQFACPCCGYFTLSEAPPGTYEICVVCSWEDDHVQFEDPSYEGGANSESLNTARANFKAFGARSKADLGRVRTPTPEEMP
jgi:hypothetical protein